MRDTARKYGTTSRVKRRLALLAFGLLLGLLAPAAWAQCGGVCTGAGSDFSKLSLVIELHVENPLMDKAAANSHVRQIAEAAYAHGVPLSIGLSTDFLDDYASDAAGLADLVGYLQSQCCHSVNLHAGIAEEADGASILTQLTSYRGQLAGAGADTTVASGVCNEVSDRYGWVEAAREAGLTAVAGVVEYCQGSLSSANSYYIDPASCSPGSCHDAAPADDPAQRVATWRTRRTRRWIRPIRSHRNTLVVIGSLGEASLPCLGESAAGRPCGPTQSFGFTGASVAGQDAQAFVDLVLEAQDNYRSGDTGDAVHVTYSTNEAADFAWMNGVFGAIQARLGTTLDHSATPLSSTTQWSTLPAVAAAN